MGPATQTTASREAFSPNSLASAGAAPRANIGSTQSAENAAKRSRFAARKRRGDTDATLHGHLEAAKPAAPSGAEVAALAPGVPKDARFMHVPTDARTSKRQATLERLRSAMRDEDAELAQGEAPVGSVSQTASTQVGMVAAADGAEALSDASVFLEGRSGRSYAPSCLTCELILTPVSFFPHLSLSLYISDTEMLPLDVRDLPSFSLFPGQVVAVRGVNNNGRALRCELLREGPGALAPRGVAPARIMERQTARQGRPLRMIVAAGPFTCAADQRYEPLDALIAVVREEAPDALLLLGPLMDAENAEIKSGTLHLAFDDMFRSQVTPRLVSLQQALPAMRIIVQPSPRDVVHSHVFPQPPLRPAQLGGPAGIFGVANPAMVGVDEFSIGAVNCDVLFQLGAREVSRLAPAGDTPDRMSRLCRHLLRQRTFFPLDPAAPETPLDPVLGGDDAGIEFGAWTPDMVVLPSVLKPFAKVVDGVVFVNPGPLAKGQGGGTYASVSVYPLDQGALDAHGGSVSMPVGAAGRTRVDIKRV